MIRHCYKYKDHQEQNYASLQIRENANRSFHDFSCRSRVGNNFKDITHQQEFRHMSNYNECCQSRDKPFKPFNRNNDYHLPYQIHNFSDVEIPGDYTDNELELLNLS